MRTSHLLSLGLATALVGANVHAQSCAVVQDINTNGSGRSSNITGDRLVDSGNHFARGFVQCGTDFYFSASTLAHGEELWKSDGTAAGTVRVTDINPGAGSSSISAITCIDIGAGPRLWFRANNGTTGTELWTSDGTAAGTSLVKDINPGTGSGFPFYMEKLGNKIIFSANGGTNGTELWITDGTAAGTVELLDIRSGSSSSSPAYMITDGTTCYFRANDGTNGTELWKTDGTAAGTMLVLDIRPGTSSSSPNYFTKHNGTMLFSAFGPNGTELWKTDGTVAGTVEVKDIFPGTSSSSLNMFYTATIGTDLFFGANDGTNGTELWKTDGTTMGTVLVSDVRTGSSSAVPTDFYVDGTKLYFEANAGNGNEPFVYDGTTVTALGDISPGTSSSSPSNFMSIGGGKVLFSASSGTTAPGTGTELYVTDGTAAGTMLVQDINSGTASSSPSWFTSVGGAAILFTALTATNGRELWFSAGTAASTILIKDIEPAVTTLSSSPFWGSTVEARRSINGSTLYFEADDGNMGDELWRLQNGVVAPIKDINTTSATANGDPREFTELFDGTKSVTVFEATDGTSGFEPWVTDGTAAGTVRLADLRPGTSSSSPGNWRRVGEKVFFTANDGTTGTELYVTDGTPAGTMQLVDIRAGSSSSLPAQLYDWNGTLYFSANDGTNGTELWTSDGTAAGTMMLVNINPGTGSSSPTYFTEVGGKLYFRANGGTNGTELWVTDGTAAGTMEVADIRTGSSSSSPFNLTACNGKLFFTANDGTTGTELWVSDGTAAGTMRLSDIYPGTSSSSPGDLICSGNTVYFDAFWSSSVGGNGREPYKSDGTVAGTMLIVDLNPGSSSGNIDYPVAAGNGGIYFDGFSAATGSELYYTDGTAAGTVLVCEGAPAATSSSVAYLTYVGNQLVFRATSPLLGSELHTMPVPPRAHTLNYGLGCGSSNGKIRSTDPVLNTTAVISGTAPSGVPSVALLGFPLNTPQPLILSSPCALHVNLLLPIVNLGAITTTNWSANLPIPNDMGLVGGRVAAQAFYVLGSPILAESSDAVSLVIGN